ncbi:MAG: cupin domain-containing protein [Spirochaetes bacterium]|nr:cupin domain-containing protein [Spirochaetota bacterium]
MIIRREEIKAIDFKGLRIFDYTSRSNEKSSFAVIDVQPEVSHPLSWSKRSDKYYYILSGEIDFTINNNYYCLKQGDFCVIKIKDKFRYKNNTNEVVSLILIHTPGFELNEEVFE